MITTTLTVTVNGVKMAFEMPAREDNTEVCEGTVTTYQLNEKFNNGNDTIG